MIVYIDYDEKPRSNAYAYGGTSRSSSGNKQIVGYGGSYKKDVVRTTRTEYHENYTFGTRIPFVEQPWSNRAQVREFTSRTKTGNKKTGSYERVTVKEKISKGETHVEKSTGRRGIGNEYKKSSTVKIGNKAGYTEYHQENRVRQVKYNGKSSSRLNRSSKNASISINHANAGIKKNTSIRVSHGKNMSTSVKINYVNESKSRGKRKAK